MSLQLDLSNTLSISSIQSKEYLLRFFHFTQDHKVIEAVLEMIEKLGNDENYIIQYCDQRSGRKSWRCQGTKDVSYICFENYCSCQSFAHLSRTSENAVLCKHLLAIQFATKNGMLQDKEVTHVEVIDINYRKGKITKNYD
jgi:predicted nucleic acid-binding Zn finger protein